MEDVQPDLLLHECVERFDVDQLALLLPSYKVASTVFDANNLGLPVRRKRRYTVAWLCESRKEEQEGVPLLKLRQPQREIEITKFAEV